MAVLPPFFLDCVVAIGRRANDVFEASASGFLYGDFVEAEGDQKRYSVYLVTNRHVLAGLKDAQLRFNPSGDQPAREYSVTLSDASGNPRWLAHPDEEVDIAIMPILASRLIADGIDFNYFRSDQHVQPKAAAIAAGVAEGDGTFVLGFPMGLVGGNRNYVIARQGAIARIRDWLGGAAKDFLIDVAVFPGNSGGPVVGRPDLNAISGTKATQAAWLLGVVKSYVPYLDVAVSKQTGRTRIAFEENSGLASVVPIDYVMETLEAHKASQPAPTPVQEEAKPPEESSPSKPISDAHPRKERRGANPGARKPRVRGQEPPSPSPRKDASRRRRT